MRFVYIALIFCVFSAEARIKRFSQVSEVVYRGSRPSAESDFAELASLGIKKIYNLQGGDYADNACIGYIIPYWEKGETPKEIETERAVAARYGIEMVSVPMNSMKVPNEEQSRRIDELVAALGMATEPVFVHCAAGADRTGLIMALYRMCSQGWRSGDAHDEMIAKGHSPIRMITTWPLDAYFFKFIKRVRDSRSSADPDAPLCPNFSR